MLQIIFKDKLLIASDDKYIIDKFLSNRMLSLVGSIRECKILHEFKDYQEDLAISNLEGKLIKITKIKILKGLQSEINGCYNLREMKWIGGCNFLSVYDNDYRLVTSDKL